MKGKKIEKICWRIKLIYLLLLKYGHRAPLFCLLLLSSHSFIQSTMPHYSCPQSEREWERESERIASVCIVRVSMCRTRSTYIDTFVYDCVTDNNVCYIFFSLLFSQYLDLVFSHSMCVRVDIFIWH